MCIFKREKQKAAASVCRRQCQNWHHLFMSQYFKENGSTCETSPTALVVFKTVGISKMQQRCLQNDNVPSLWLKWKTSERSTSHLPPSPLNYLFHQRDRVTAKESLAQYSNLTIAVCNKQKDNQNLTHNAFPKWTEVVSPEKQRKPSVKQDNLFLFPITGCFSFLLRVLTARPKIWNIELNVIQKRMN